MRIDSNQHFWKCDYNHYNWLTEDMESIHRELAPEDLKSRLKKCGIDKTVLMQVSPYMSETNYMLSLAHSIDFVVGVVGWVDMYSVDAPYNLARLSKNSFFKGVRPMIQDIVDDAWMLRPELKPVFLTLMELGLCFDALVKPRHLKQLLILANRYPNLKIVIDHAAKPKTAKDQFAEWAQNIQSLADKPNVYCKLSGLVTRAGYNHDLDILAPYMSHLLKTFGASRLMWGSDWPILNLATDYSQWFALTEVFLAGLSIQQQTQILSKTTVEFYNLGGESLTAASVLPASLRHDLEVISDDGANYPKV